MKLDPLTKYLFALALAFCQPSTQAGTLLPVAAENGMVAHSIRYRTSLSLSAMHRKGLSKGCTGRSLCR